MKIIGFRCISIISVFLFVSTLKADTPTHELHKTVEKSFEVSELTNLSFTNSRGDLNIINSEGTMAKIEAQVTVRSENKEEIQKVLNQIEVMLDESGNYIYASLLDNINCWNIHKGFFRSNNTITFKDGSKAQDIESIELDVKLYVPKIKKLEVSNKYNDIHFETIKNDFEVDLTSGKLIGNNIEGAFDLNIKYGKMKIGDFSVAEMTIYDSDVVMANGADVILKSKYSDIEMGNTNSLDLNSFDDEIDLGNVDCDLNIEAKYSEIKGGNYKDGEMSLFDSDLNFENGNTLKLNSKYGSMEFFDLEVADLSFFSDEFIMGNVKELLVENSKYTTIKINMIKEEFRIQSSFDDNIFVRKVATTFKHLLVKSKYTDITFPLMDEQAYQVEAKISYGNLRLNDKVEWVQNISSNSKQQLRGFVNGGNQDSPLVEIDVYDGDVNLEY